MFSVTAGKPPVSLQVSRDACSVSSRHRGAALWGSHLNVPLRAPYNLTARIHNYLPILICGVHYCPTRGGCNGLTLHNLQFCSFLFFLRGIANTLIVAVRANIADAQAWFVASDEKIITGSRYFIIGSQSPRSYPKQKKNRAEESRGLLRACASVICTKNKQSINIRRNKLVGQASSSISS